MALNNLINFTHRKATVFMDEKIESFEERETKIKSIVHEIRNPLTAIKLTNSLIQESCNEEEPDKVLIKSYMAIIADNVTKIEGLLKEALTFKQTETAVAQVNISKCAEKALELARDRVYLGGIEVFRSFNHSHWVYGHEQQLVTAFLNIIINSIEAIKTKSGKLWIDIHEMNRNIRITFKDNGNGMEAAVVNKIFDPLFSTKDGIGIGLYTVKEIVNTHKANIVVDSLPGVGTSVSILFNGIPGEKFTDKSKWESGPLSDNH